MGILIQVSVNLILSAMIKIVFLLSVFVATNCYHYNGYPYSISWPEAPHYPSYCCPLEWVNMTRGQELPKDWIKAGTITGRDFAFTRTDPYLYVGAKSSRKEDDPYGIGWTVPNPFPILTNPNKCHIDWYTTIAHGDVPEPSEEIFFPSTGNTEYGSYAQHDGVPGLMASDGDMAKMKSMSDYEWYKESGVRLLYVDCKKSFKSMYDFKLSKLTFEQETVDKIKQSDRKLIHARKEYHNYSPRDSSASLKFSVVTKSHLNLTLNGQNHPRVLLKDDTYKEWVDSVRIHDLMSDLRYDTVDHDHERNWKAAENGDIFGAAHEEVFDFDQEITIPASSKVVVTAFSKRIRGEIPFQVVYEMKLVNAGDNLVTLDMINANIARYTKENIIHFDNGLDGKYKVTYDGVINFNTGNNVQLEIKSEPINGFSESNGNPIPS